MKMDIFIQWLNTPLILTVILIVLGVFTSIGIWIGKVNSDRASFKDFMKEIRKDIKIILGRLPPRPVTGSSPLRLTDLGESISQTLEARHWAVRTAEELQGRIQGMQPYEIQDFCSTYIKNEFTPDALQKARIKECAYEHGIESTSVLEVLMVELRDKLLELSTGPTSGPTPSP